MNETRRAALGVLYASGFLLAFIGIVLLINSAWSNTSEASTRYATPGYVCLGIGALFVLTAAVLAFIAGTPVPRRGTSDADPPPIS